YANCPLYRERFAQSGARPGDLRGPEDLRRALPPLTKQDIQGHGPRLIAANWPRADLLRNQTGGSTGQPITFYLSRDRKCSGPAPPPPHTPRGRGGRRRPARGRGGPPAPPPPPPRAPPPPPRPLARPPGAAPRPPPRAPRARLPRPPAPARPRRDPGLRPRRR